MRAGVSILLISLYSPQNGSFTTFFAGDASQQPLHTSPACKSIRVLLNLVIEMPAGEE